jgi:septum formation protein
MERLGVPFRCREPLVDEEALKDNALSPRALAESLAQAKATSVASVVPDAVVVGGDQLVSFEGRVLGKPGDRSRAVEQLLELSGRPHELVTAIAVCHPGGMVEYTDLTTLWMRPLSRIEAERYVDADRPSDCSGSYKLEQRGITLFERIESLDHTAITGLPLIALTTILRDLGFPIP